MRIGVTLIAAIWFAFAAPAGAVDDRYWPISKLMRAIDRAPVSVQGRSVRVDTDTTLCTGRRDSRRIRGVRAWRSFACTFTMFTRAGVDRDLDFRVRTLGARRFVITDPHWVGETR